MRVTPAGDSGAGKTSSTVFGRGLAGVPPWAVVVLSEGRSLP